MKGCTIKIKEEKIVKKKLSTLMFSYSFVNYFYKAKNIRNLIFIFIYSTIYLDF